MKSITLVTLACLLLVACNEQSREGQTSHRAGHASPRHQSPSAQTIPSAQSQPVAKANHETREPVLIFKQPPIYPPSPLHPLYPTGTVLLELTVSETGSVKKVRVLKSLYPDLDKRSVDAAYTWKYNPALKDGRPVQAVIQVPVKYIIK